MGLEAISVYRAKVVNRFQCRLTGRIYEVGDIYEAESEERIQELASLDPPRVEPLPRAVEHDVPKPKRRGKR